MAERTCSIEGCEKPVKVLSSGWCAMHYYRWRRTGTTDLRPRVSRRKVCAIPDCGRPVSGRGWCVMHYSRWRAHGHPLAVARATLPPEVRFWFYVGPGGPDDCWIWQGQLAYGYGVFSNGRRGGYAAHRFSYELCVAPIPEGLQLDHLCRNPPCVNPLHLEPVTPRENTLRGTSFAAINATKTHCIRGHEFTPENTYVRPNGGGRACRACDLRRKSEANQRRQTA